MHRLRHPVRAIREPFGTAGLIVALVALVAALGGTALAAKGALTGKQKKEVEKIAKKFAGKPGTPGSTGAQGPKGDTGAAGANGTAGSNGTNGTDGVSPKGTAFSGESHGCKEGGVEIKGANTTFVCNGVKGTNGQTGFTETLPIGKTETGTWGFHAPAPLSEPILMTQSTSFNIPLAVAPNNVRFLKPGEEETPECPGTLEKPEAAPGEMCFYSREYEHSSLFQIPGFYPAVYTTGVVMFFVAETAEAVGVGTWAVKAE